MCGLLSVAGTCNILMLLLELNTAVTSVMYIPDAVSEFICVLSMRCTVSIHQLFWEIRCV